MCPEFYKVKFLGIYLHIPFCPYRCHYCDFLLLTNRQAEIPDYAGALSRDIKNASKDYDGYTVKSVFIGGGTPSLLSSEQAATLMTAIQQTFPMTPNAEITLESNPDTLSVEKLSGYLEAGINRLSIGVQSTQDRHLERMGRRHRTADAKKAFEAARNAGFKNISVDGLFGLPDQTLEELIESLSIMTSWRPEHLSIYGLQVEEGTRFFKERDSLNFPGEEIESEMLEKTIDFLEARGYCQYEISNYAKPGFESVHNQIYWNNEEYLGFGLGAVSYIDGERFWMTRNLSKYLSGEERVAGSERLAKDARIGETIMLGLRQKQGISSEQFKRRFGTDLFSFPQIGRLETNGLLSTSDNRLRLTRKGVLLASEVAKEFLA